MEMIYSLCKDVAYFTRCARCLSNVQRLLRAVFPHPLGDWEMNDLMIIPVAKRKVDDFWKAMNSIPEPPPAWLGYRIKRL